MPPTTIFRLRYETPRVLQGEPEDNYADSGAPVEDENGALEFQEATRYYLSRSSLNRKLRDLEDWSNKRQLGWEPPVAGRVLSIDTGTIDWMAPDGHGEEV